MKYSLVFPRLYHIFIIFEIKKAENYIFILFFENLFQFDSACHFVVPSCIYNKNKQKFIDHLSKAFTKCPMKVGNLKTSAFLN